MAAKQIVDKLCRKQGGAMRHIPLLRHQRGVSSIEYALLAALIALALIAGLTQLSTSVLAMWDYVVTNVLNNIGNG